VNAVHRLPYGCRSIEVAWPTDAVLKELTEKPLPDELDERQIIRDALSDPISSDPLSEIVQEDEKVCVIIGDVTRQWVRSHVFLPQIVEELNRGGVNSGDISVVCATGDHRSHTEEEHAALMGEDLYGRLEIFDHCCRDEENMVYMGHTTRDTPVWINSTVAEADRVVVTGGIVYHFLAGFGGGGKALLPGVSAYESIMANHSLALSDDNDGGGLNPEVAAGRMKGNPCYEDIVAAAGMVAPDFLFNVIVDEDEARIALAVAGNVRAAHRVGCRLVEQHFSCGIGDQSEVVVASAGGFPKDINLYQTYKTLYNARRAVQDGGTLLILSECREGMGNEDFAGMIAEHTDNSEREAALRESFTIGGYMAYHASLISAECDVLLLSSLAPTEVKESGMTPVQDIEEAYTFIREKHGVLPPAYFMPHGSVFPVTR